MTDMLTTNGAADEADLQEFEQKIGVALPLGYRRFLQRSNGGKTIRQEFRVPGWGSSIVHAFFGFNLGGANDLEWNLDVYDDLLDAGVLAIATDPGGNRICLGVSGEAVENVYFWDHESGTNELILLANSFDTFVSGLKASSAIS